MTTATFIDFITKESEISFEGTIEFEEFLEHVREWFEQHGYEINEKVYLSLPGKKSDIKWECKKTIDDYHRFVINVKFKLTAEEEGKLKRKIAKGTLRFIYDAAIERDYENKSINKIRFFWRAFYDKFIMVERESTLRKEIKDDVSLLVKEVKTYLNI